MSRTFATLVENKSAGDYIIKKKAGVTMCDISKCYVNNKFSSESIRQGVKRAKYEVFPSRFNRTQLYVNLQTKIDLSDVSVVEDLSGNVVPSVVDSTTEHPYLRYNIDPSGSLFGNTVCGNNNYVNYLVYNTDDATT